MESVSPYNSVKAYFYIKSFTNFTSLKILKFEGKYQLAYRLDRVVHENNFLSLCEQYLMTEIILLSPLPYSTLQDIIW